MPLFMDEHDHGDRLTAEAVAGPTAISKSSEARVHYLRYWFDEASRKVFCLVEGARCRRGGGRAGPGGRRPHHAGAGGV
jgi:hypothetical protein